MPMSGDDDLQLPAFERSRQINAIFDGVQSCIPDMEFSDYDEDDTDHEIDIVTRENHPSISHIQTNSIINEDSNFIKDGETNHNELVENGERNESNPHQNLMTNGSIEKAITDLSVHTFIDSLVGQLAEHTSLTEDYSYNLEGSIDDLDLDQVITLLQTSPDLSFSHDNLSENSDVISLSSDSTIVMDELERLAETYDMTDSFTPRDTQSRDTQPLDTIPLEKPAPLSTVLNFDTDLRGSPEPDTIKLDLRPKTPATTPTRAGRLMPHHLTKKFVHPPSSDSDDEYEKEVWANMRNKVKSTVKSTGVTTQSTGVTTKSMGVTTQSMGITTKSMGVTTQSTGVTTKYMGITTKSMGVTTQCLATPDVTTQSPNLPTTRTTRSMGVTTLSTSTQSSTYVPRNSHVAYVQNNNKVSFSSGSVERERENQLSRYETFTSKCNKTQSKHNKKLTFNENTKEEKPSTEKSDKAKSVKLEPDRMKEPEIMKENNTSETVFTEDHKIPTAWTENDNIAVTGAVNTSNKNKTMEIHSLDDNRLEDKVATENRKRTASIKLREKRLAFKSRLEEAHNKKHVIFDVDESFCCEKVSDLPRDLSRGGPNDDLLMLELMVDNQGELSSLPPEYYAYCYNDIPTVSIYGIEGVITWLLTSQTLPFRVVSTRLTFINNCLSYIFLIKQNTTTNNFYGDITQFLSSSTVAQSDPALFSSTILNPRDYPFCETLNKIFLISEYKQNVFSTQPACCTHNLVPDKQVNEILNNKTKHKISLPDLQDQVAPFSHTEFCVSTLSGHILSSQRGLFHVLTSVRDSQLEISGMRLLHEQTDKHTDHQTKLCLVITGYSAISSWADKLGPVDEQLALRTDPDSVRAVLSKMGYSDVSITNTRSADKTRVEMARYFGHKFTDTTTTNINGMTYPLVFERSYDYFFLLISPLISPSLLGDILTILQNNGVSLLGIRRSRLNYRKCVGIGLSECQTKVFSKFNGTPLTSPSLSSSNGSTPSEDRSFFPHNFSTDASPSQPTLASTILFLSKRNGLYHSRFLIKELKSQVVDENLTHTMRDTPDLSLDQLSDPFLYFEIVPYSENTLWNVGGPFGLVPERKTFDFFMSHKQNTLSDKSDLEQIVFIAMPGKDLVSRAGSEISNLINYSRDAPCDKTQIGYLELLGVKLIPKLSSFQARELTQYEVGDPQWKGDIQYLQTVPVIALLVRAINAFRIVKKLLDVRNTVGRYTGRGGTNKTRKEKIMSDTPEHAYKLASLLFFEKELYSDEILRPRQLHLPPPRTHVNSILGKDSRNQLSQLPERLVYQSEGILKSMLAPPRLLATALITEEIKHFGKIFKRLEQEEFTIVGLHLNTEDQIVICVQSENSIYKLQQLLGPDNIKEAKENHQFSLRANYSTSSDSFYGSETYNDSVADIKIHFPRGLCCPNTLDLQAEGIPHSYVDELADAALQKHREYTVKPCFVRPLLQTVCVVFPPDLLKCAKHTRLSPASQIITLIQTCHFEIMNTRLITLAPTQIYHLKNMFKLPLHTEVWQSFANRPCLVLALQRENAASCFMQILQGYANVHNKKLLDTYEHLILVSPNKKKAEQHLTYFFDFLSNRCKDQISSII